MLNREYGELAERLVAWIKEKVLKAQCKGVVLGLSGGIDSSVTAALCKKAFPEETLGLIMPCHSHPQDQKDAELLASQLNLDYQIIDISSTFDTLLFSIKEREEGERSMAVANIKPRLRMAVLYYYAQHRSYLVAGTDNRTELLLGYFTKHGDGGIDFSPLGNLVKMEVRRLAIELKIPEQIIEKPPSAGLWEGQKDEEELGFTYGEVDRYILTGEASDELRRRVDGLARKNCHKLQAPDIPNF